jgi:hypothetical protein
MNNHKIKTMTNIQKLVFYSKTILMLKLLKIKFNNFLMEITEIRIHIPNNDTYFKAMVKDIDTQISILNNQIRLILQSFFGKKNFEGYNNVNSWGLTKKDLEKGYLKLVEIGTNRIYLLVLSTGHVLELTKSTTSVRQAITLGLSAKLFGDLPDINKSLLSKPLKIRKG